MPASASSWRCLCQEAPNCLGICLWWKMGAEQGTVHACGILGERWLF